MSIRIITAMYGTLKKAKDVKNICQELVTVNNKIPVNNSSMEGDPDYGTQKKLHVIYVFNGNVSIKTCIEGETLDLTQT